MRVDSKSSTESRAVFHTEGEVAHLSADETGLWFVEKVDVGARSRSKLWRLTADAPELFFECSGNIVSPVGCGDFLYLALGNSIMSMELDGQHAGPHKPELVADGQLWPAVVIADDRGIAWCNREVPSPVPTRPELSSPGDVMTADHGAEYAVQCYQGRPMCLCLDESNLYIGTDSALLCMDRDDGPATTLAEYEGDITGLLRVGEYLYYNVGTIWRIPRRGGPPVEILGAVERPVALTADGKDRIFIAAGGTPTSPGPGAGKDDDRGEARPARVIALTEHRLTDMLWTGYGQICGLAHNRGDVYLAVRSDDGRGSAIVRIDASPRSRADIARTRGSRPLTERPPVQASSPFRKPPSSPVTAIQAHVVSQIQSSLRGPGHIEVWRENAGSVRFLKSEDTRSATFYRPDGAIFARFPKVLTDDQRAYAEAELVRGCQRHLLAAHVGASGSNDSDDASDASDIGGEPVRDSQPDAGPQPFGLTGMLASLEDNQPEPRNPAPAGVPSTALTPAMEEPDDSALTAPLPVTIDFDAASGASEPAGRASVAGPGRTPNRSGSELHPGEQKPAPDIAPQPGDRRVRLLMHVRRLPTGHPDNRDGRSDPSAIHDRPVQKCRYDHSQRCPGAQAVSGHCRRARIFHRSVWRSATDSGGRTVAGQTGTQPEPV